MDQHFIGSVPKSDLASIHVQVLESEYGSWIDIRTYMDWTKADRKNPNTEQRNGASDKYYLKSGIRLPIDRIPKLIDLLHEAKELSNGKRRKKTATRIG